MKNLTIKDIIYINNLTIKKHSGSLGIKNQSLISLWLGVTSGFLGKDDIKSFIIKHKR